MFDIEKFRTGKYFVATTNHDEFAKVMDFLSKFGYEWSDGVAANEKEYTFYDNSGTHVCISNFGDLTLHEGPRFRFEADGLHELNVNYSNTPRNDKTNDELFEEISNDLSNREHYQQLVLENRDVYLDKNKKYGDSFTDTIEKYGYISALTRMHDKFSRIEEFITEGYEDEEESLRDSLMDLANYCYMTVMALERDQNENHRE